MTRFNKSALLASVVALGMSGAAFAQEATGGGEVQDNSLPITVIDMSGNSTEVVGPSTGGAGPMGGWPVYSSDNAMLGNITTAAITGERVVDYIIFALANGNEVQLDATGIASVGDDSVMIAVSEADVLSLATAPMTALEFRDGTAVMENAAEAKAEAIADEPLSQTNEPTAPGSN
ncbi:hypothetical protein GVY41_07425 [Frigidibacter albus]|uniref:PRC-barrel domain-containing protein n=1 Tax=Frigidibacter albus TaxID=1465486 RepID=A0A6L8VFM8_9RHOB|nr:hypothetical protein [Frigidibacter albus]MZQ89115.1 hypothetical protein [Frigidibacter albus]NBE30828.1 hypothetical protein [Frigidibacter albus]GGH51332.1 hypothetical protein GCM10011341_14910 [Frigidibacter albus]